MLRNLMIGASLIAAAAAAPSAFASPATDEARRLLAQNQDAAAFERVESASRRGDMDATALLGWFYDTGRHVAQDHARAAELYRRAMRDNPSVQWRLGVMYDLGQGVAEDPAQAVRLFREAAREDDVNAMVSLGVMYANGRGVAADYAEAMRHYRRAAERGAGPGFLGIGMLHQYGLGVLPSASEAAAWYLAAHALRDTRARQLLGALGLDQAAIGQAAGRANQILESFRRRERVAAPAG